MKLRSFAPFVVIVAFFMVKACPAQAAQHKVTITFTPATHAQTAGISYTFKLYRSTTSGGEGTTAYQAIPGSGYVDTAITNGATYFYKVSEVKNCDSTVWNCAGYPMESVLSAEFSSGQIPLSPPPAGDSPSVPTAATAVIQ